MGPLFRSQGSNLTVVLSFIFNLMYKTKQSNCIDKFKGKTHTYDVYQTDLCKLLAFLYLAPFQVNYSHSYLIQLAPQKVNQHIRCLYWLGTLPANLIIQNEVDIWVIHSKLEGLKDKMSKDSQ